VWIQNVTFYVCRQNHCGNIIKSGINTKTLRYLKDHGGIGVTPDAYIHFAFEDMTDKLKRTEKLARPKRI